ncbi:epoxide hydrolase [Bailinhaonella thermotolerans]|uniref:Epoxide hydrolase n=1 Tax=Bailinhaonella thermotolerans TaxID=1070861 RepID=A0A3A4AX81_9ACTN|nr:epoxide hydrolase [Bailinhaonella thermotolerans]
MEWEPFRVEVAQEELDGLRERLARTRWPEGATAEGWAQGAPLEWVRDLCRYWEREYNWRRCEAALNALPQFRAVVDGLPIHVVHARSPYDGAMPLVLTNGWPGSITEYLKVIGPLTDPVAYGGDFRDAFHVICPALPGYGFSGKPDRPGWGIERIAAAWITLARGLGYERFGAAGSDWGTSVSTLMARRRPDLVAGIHLMPPIAAPGPDGPGGFTPAERKALEDLAERQATGDGYSAVHATRPQTVGYALTDSPAGLCAWIAEKWWTWSDRRDGIPFTPDELLDNVMMYWLPRAAASSARLYWESIGQVKRWFTEPDDEPVTVPAGCTVFPAELPRPSRRWAARRFADIRHWGEPERGGHFPAVERPGTFVAELRAFFRHVR